jgi:Zinc finger found in FPG and IleRS
MQERLEVYRRTGEPCLRCGRPIRRIVVGGRSTHFCSWCQRLGAKDRAAATAILRSQTPSGRSRHPVPATARRGERWTERAPAGTLGLTDAEAARAAARARTERTRLAAATRRAAARGERGAFDGAAGGPGAPSDRRDSGNDAGAAGGPPD